MQLVQVAEREQTELDPAPFYRAAEERDRWRRSQRISRLLMKPRWVEEGDGGCDQQQVRRLGDGWAG